MRRVISRSIVFVLLCSVLSAAHVSAQQAPLPPTEAYVPSMALGAAVIRPQAVINYPDYTPQLKMFPVEVVEAWGEVNLGLNPLSIAEFKLIWGMPMGPAPPPFGLVVTFLEDFDPENLSPELLAEEGPQTIDGRRVYPLDLPDAPVELLLEPLDSRTCLIADPLMLESMRTSKNGDGPVAELLKANPIGRANTQVVLAIYPLRPLIAEFAANPPEEAPREIQELIRGAVLVNSVVLRSKFDTEATITRLEILADDAEGATKLHGLIDGVLEMAKPLVRERIREVAEDMEPGPIADAVAAYLNRLADEMFAAYRPQLRDDRLLVDAQASLSVATVGVLTGLLLPAVQAAREAARRMSSSNNLKQIGLAMHNYHDTFNKFPSGAIMSDDGKPLLSWRVAILPFVEEINLYERFRLDEPWDSPHNIQLLEEMPPVYATPGFSLLEGHTVYHAAVGTGYALEPERQTSFRDIIDGASNTVLAFEGNAASQVPWTAPEFVEIDPNDPPANFRGARPGGFNVLFADGSVQFITDMIDPEMFKALLTRAGNEPVNLP